MTEPVRLAHIFSSDLGIPAVLPYVAPLRHRNWEVTFITPAGALVSKAAAEGYRWLPHRFTRRIDFGGDLRATADLAATLVRERFDIVHTHNFKVSLVGRVLAGLTRAPIVVHTIHGITWSIDTPEPSRSINALLERVASVPAHLILSQSQADCDAFLRMRVVAKDKIRVIGNGIPFSRFDPAKISPAVRAATRSALGVQQHETLFLFPGRMVREKGLEEVFIAAEMVGSTGIRVAIAGRDDAERDDAISSACYAAAERARVLLLGERTDMAQLYAACDVAGLASWREGMPRALMEGAAMGRPLLATDIRGNREVVRAGLTGLLVRPKSPAALADGMRALAHDPAMRSRMGEAARRDALERFDLDVVVSRVTSAYDELLAKRKT
jgi:glycosyltransferase involved in cell wall biosynthesis